MGERGEASLGGRADSVQMEVALVVLGLCFGCCSGQRNKLSYVVGLKTSGADAAAEHRASANNQRGVEVSVTGSMLQHQCGTEV